jgi:ribosomal protein S2
VILAYIPDLLFGSQVVGALGAAGHQVKLVSTLEGAERPDLLIVDLCADAQARIAQARALGVPTLAFYAHVETDVRSRAQEAGLDRIVPRSRMAREGVQLVDQLLRGADDQ